MLFTLNFIFEIINTNEEFNNNNYLVIIMEFKRPGRTKAPDENAGYIHQATFFRSRDRPAVEKIQT